MNQKLNGRGRDPDQEDVKRMRTEKGSMRR